MVSQRDVPTKYTHEDFLESQREGSDSSDPLLDLIRNVDPTREGEDTFGVRLASSPESPGHSPWNNLRADSVFGTNEVCFETDQPEREAEVESLEVFDDPVRMYLIEIGRVPLLTPVEERLLARGIEGGKFLDDLRDRLSELEGRKPRSWEITKALLKRIVAVAPLVNSLS